MLHSFCKSSMLAMFNLQSWTVSPVKNQSAAVLMPVWRRGAENGKFYSELGIHANSRSTSHSVPASRSNCGSNTRRRTQRLLYARHAQWQKPWLVFVECCVRLSWRRHVTALRRLSLAKRPRTTIARCRDRAPVRQPPLWKGCEMLDQGKMYRSRDRARFQAWQQRTRGPTNKVNKNTCMHFLHVGDWYV